MRHETKPEANMTYFLPTKPYDIIACVNRIAAATGSVGYAIAAANADYNGHHNTLKWNDYRGYYVGEYYWGGREVFVRTTDFRVALTRSIKVYDHQGLGAVLFVTPRPQDEEIVKEFPRLLPHSTEVEAAETAKWRTWKHEQAAAAIRMERQFGVPHVGHLIKAATLEEYKALVDADFEARKKHRAT